MDFQEYVMRGIAFYKERETDQAIENIEAALRIQPNNAEICGLLEQLKQLKQEEDIRKAGY
jgi:tetratricopeptide (TPR) repeat protein